MLSGPSSRAEQLIYKRRAYDDKISTMQTKLKQEFHQQQFAKWQGKGKNVQINTQLRAKMYELRQQAQNQLQQRRQKLATQLQQENQQYQQEIVQLQQTPEQVRQRMTKRVTQLKQQKQTRRQQQVSEKLDKRFIQNADELRKVDQDLKELKTAYERNIQLVEKQTFMQNQYEEEVLFAELNKRDIKRKEQIEKVKQQQYKEKVDERNAILAVQMEMKQKKETNKKIMNQKEKQMLRDEWERQSQLQKMKEQNNMEKMKENNRVLMEENQKLRKDKLQEAKKEHQKDREMIERIVAKQRQLAEYEKQMKQKEREEARKILMGFRNKNYEMAAYEKELDRLIEQQRLRIQKKQDELWRQRERARLNLLHQVFDDRGKKVNEHRVHQNEELKEKQLDRIQIERRLKQYHDEKQRKKRQQMMRNKVQQQKLLKEIAQKEQKRRLLMLQLHNEEQEMDRQRKVYEEKIQDRKNKGKSQLEVFKQTNRLF